MRKKICLCLSMLLFILYVSGQEADEPLRYDATDTKRISYGDSTWITRKDNAPQGELLRWENRLRAFGFYADG